MVHTARRKCPTHPRSVVAGGRHSGDRQDEIARLVGISRQHLYDILRERNPVSPAIAVR
jgi:antitoxin HigA-1